MDYKRAYNTLVPRLKTNLPGNLYYHSFPHTLKVIEAAERIAISENIQGKDLILLKTAALFHDSGFLYQYSRNEPVGCKIAEEILPECDYTETQIALICKMIMATRIPQQPETHLEEILCDADLDYLGTDNYHSIASSLRKELAVHNIVFQDEDWLFFQIEFLEQHKYFTKSSRQERDEGKKNHIEELKKRLENKDKS